MIMDSNILISVCMITYGHEKEIEEAVLGVLNENTQYDVELIIADDCSPDATREIVNQIIHNHKNGHWIKYHRHNKNKGMVKNFFWALDQSKGEYIAICEGDDYWVDPLKLQKQVDFLETHKECSMTSHNSLVQTSRKKNTKKVNKPYLKEGKIPTETVIRRIYDPIPTASMVLRRNVVENYPKGILSAPVGDYYLTLLALLKGYIYHFDKTMSVYRKHEASWSGKKNDIRWFISHHNNHINALTLFNEYSDFKYRQDIFSFKRVKTIELFKGIIKNGIVESHKYHKNYLEDQRKYLTIKDYLELLKFFVIKKIKRVIK